MVQNAIYVLDPTGKPRVKEVSSAPRVHDLNDKVAGFLWNIKPNGDILLLRIKEQLSRRFHFAGTRWHQKSGPAVSADTAILEELARTCDVIINAVGD